MMLHVASLHTQWEISTHKIAKLNRIKAVIIVSEKRKISEHRFLILLLILMIMFI